MGGKSSAPPAPDYTAAAQATAAGNRVNQVTPYGDLTYSQSNAQKLDQNAWDKAMATYQQQLADYENPNYYKNGAFAGLHLPGRIGAEPVAPKQSDYMIQDPNAPWTATTKLSPDQQALLNENTGLQKGLLNLADTGLGYAKNALNNPITMAQLPTSAVNPGQTGQDALMARFQPMMDQSNKQLDQQLANQGIMPGSEAYDNAWRTQNQGNNDLRMQAALEGINVGENAQNQQFQLLNAVQNQPINLVNALRTGNQVTNPTFTSTPAGPDYLGAAQMQSNYNLGTYNAQQAQRNAMNSGLFGLGAAAIMA